MVGETKFNSLDSEVRKRGESRDATQEHEDGGFYSPTNDEASTAVWRRERAEDEVPDRPAYNPDNRVFLGRFFLSLAGLSKLETDVLEAVYFRDVTGAAIRLGLTEKAVQNVMKKALQKYRGKRTVSNRMRLRAPIGEPQIGPGRNRKTQSGYWHQVPLKSG